MQSGFDSARTLETWLAILHSMIQFDIWLDDACELTKRPELKHGMGLFRPKPDSRFPEFDVALRRI